MTARKLKITILQAFRPQGIRYLPAELLHRDGMEKWFCWLNVDPRDWTSVSSLPI